MFCKFCGGSVETSFQFCPSCGKNIEEAATTSSNSFRGPFANTSQKRLPPAFDGGKAKGDPTVTKKAKELPNYKSFASEKSRERQTFFKTKSQRANKPVYVTISVGLLEYNADILKPVRGSSLPLKINVQATYEELLEIALQKRGAYDRSFSRDRGYVLAYPDASIAKLIPGTTEDFTLAKYKEGLGKSYSRINLYLGPVGPVTKTNDVRDRDVEEEPEEKSQAVRDAGEQVGIRRQETFEPDHEEVHVVPLDSDEEYSFLETDFLPVDLTELDAVEEAIRLSLEQHGNTTVGPVETENTSEEIHVLAEKIKAHLQQNVDLAMPKRKMVVSRSSIWASTKLYFKRKRFFEGTGMLEVTFATSEEELEEDAMDLGGPRRELFHLLLGAICRDSKTIIATEKGHVVRFNMKALQEDDYLIVGNMLATMVIQGGEPPRIFSPSVCHYMAYGLENCCPTIDEISNGAVRTSLEKLLKTANQEEFNQCLQVCDWRYDIEGLPITIQFEQRNCFVQEVAQYYVILRCKAMLDQLISGLKHYQVLDLIRGSAAMADFIFLHKTGVKLNAAELKQIMKPELSPKGNIRRLSEEVVLAKFLDFVNCTEDKTLLEVLKDGHDDLTDEELRFIPTITPSHMLMFSTGAAMVPVTGFQPNPSICFVHDNTKCIPSAQTCSSKLYLYVNEQTVNNSIHRYLLTALMNGGVFSKI